ncbi:hypothetical protein SBA3_2170014 [Candidatus Sulfopaludibacter sp. SbA3]|nr:hypothetical protein SBA3_2170014 [Candidatus Sulfopaludibacter sp. SbA3]
MRRTHGSGFSSDEAHEATLSKMTGNVCPTRQPKEPATRSPALPGVRVSSGRVRLRLMRPSCYFT